MATVLPGFDKFQGVRNFANNFVQGTVQNQQNQALSQQLGQVLGQPGRFQGITDPRAAQFLAQQIGSQQDPTGLAGQQARANINLTQAQTQKALAPTPQTPESQSQLVARLAQKILDGDKSPGLIEMFQSLAPKPSTVVNVNPEQAQATVEADMKIAEAYQAVVDEHNKKNPNAKTMASVKTNTTSGRRFISIDEKPKVQGVQLKQIQSLGNIMSLLDKVAGNYDPSFVGLGDEAFGKLGEFTGTTGPKETDFRANTLNIVDTITRERSGAQINETEVKRLMKIVPNLRLADSVFPSRLQSIRSDIQGRIDLALKSLEASGFDAADLEKVMRGEIAPGQLIKEKTKSKKISASEATKIMREAGGDVNKARDIARKRGLSF